MELQAAVQKYLATVHQFGKPMPLSAFGLGASELIAMISAWEDDYHLNRHFELIRSSGPGGDLSYEIDGTAYTAIVFRETIGDVLG